jgi:hypothetical protein
MFSWVTLIVTLIKRIFGALDARTGIEEMKRIAAEEALAAERAAREKERETSHEANSNPDRNTVADRLSDGRF